MTMNTLPAGSEQNMPDVWGGGQLFAFSGLDGYTNWTEPFVRIPIPGPALLLSVYQRLPELSLRVCPGFIFPWL